MTDDLDDTDQPPKPARPKRARGGIAAIAIVVAIIALVLAGWSTWRLHRFTHTALAAHQQDAATLTKLQGQIDTGNQQAQAGKQRLGNLESQLDALHSTTQGLDRRLANLETAYATLSGQQQSGRDTLLLNDAEMLLRTAQQRYELFHDSAGALKAYGQAIDVLQQVQNPAYAPVRASVTTERDALAAAAPPARQTALDTLSALRSKVPALPLASSATVASASSAATKPGFWSRVGHAFSGIVTVSRDHGPATPPADARFARQALALDLAQAQEALLAFDATTYRNALQRADATLTAQFSTQNADVQTAHAQIASLLDQHATGPAPKLGGALAQLQSLRASQTPPPPPPAPAATTGSSQP